MRKLAIFTVFCLLAGLQAEPVSDEENTPIVPKENYIKAFLKYEAEHEIVDIMVPLNALNFAASDGNSESEELNLKDLTVFFVESDVKDGKREDKGLYRFKKDNAKMILATGRSSAASRNDNKLVFFGASDGLYVYNVETDSADKYGPITDAIKSIAADATGGTIYIVTDDNKLYKVTNNGKKKDLVDDIEDAREIVLDDAGNLYYYNSKKEVYVKTADNIIKAENLPVVPESIKPIRTPFIVHGSVWLAYHNRIYIIKSNGSIDTVNCRFSPDATPTAYGPEAVYVQYYGYEKKLYEFNIKEMMENKQFENLKELNENMRNQANKDKHTLGAKTD